MSDTWRQQPEWKPEPTVDVLAEVRSTLLWGRINAAGDLIRSAEWIAGEDHALDALREVLRAGGTGEREGTPE